MFALTPQEVQTSYAIVTSTLFVCGTKALVLFDLISIHSFVSLHLVSKLGRFYYGLEERLIITTPLKEVFMVEYVYKFCMVRIKNKDTLADLVLLLTFNFDVILRIDWLAFYYAKMD